MQLYPRRLLIVVTLSLLFSVSLGLVTRRPAFADAPDGADTAPAGAVVSVPATTPQGDPQTFFAIDVRNQEYLTISSAAPENPTILGIMGDQIYGGDFISDTYTTLYAVNNSGDTFVGMDTATGALSVIGELGKPIGGGTWSGLAWDRTTGTLYASSAAASGAHLYTINMDTGAATSIGPVTGLQVLIDIAIHPTTGDLYGINTNDDNLYRIDKGTAAPTLIGALNYPADFAQGMDFDDNSGVLYWAAYRGSANGPGSIRTIDIATGNSTEIGIIGDGAPIRELDAFAWIAPDNPTAITLSDWTVGSDVPTPALLLVGLALAGILLVWRGRRSV